MASFFIICLFLKHIDIDTYTDTYTHPYEYTRNLISMSISEKMSQLILEIDEVTTYIWL